MSSKPPVFVTATLQAAVIAGMSNILAQTMTAYQENKALVIDWVSVFQFFLFAVVSTPPNILWQDFLESTFPAYLVAPATPEADKALDQPKLDIRHTLTKTLLDQTAGAAVNTLLFSVFMGGLKQAMAHHRPAGRAIDYGAVDWRAVLARSRAEFWGIMRAGWTFWPFVSIVNFAFVEGVQARNLVGSLAGVAWGVYMSLFAAR